MRNRFFAADAGGVGGKIPLRSELAAEDCWDLSSLFACDDDWEAAFAEFESLKKKIPSFKGTLASSAGALSALLDFLRSFNLLEERLAYYADLRVCEDEGADAARERCARLTIAAAAAAAELSWTTPEIQGIANAKIEEFLKDERLADYRIYVKKLLRWKPYVLSDAEERIVALEGETDAFAGDAFSVLTNVDFDFGSIDVPDEGLQPLSQSNWHIFMESEDRDLRKNAFVSFYSVFDAHKTTLAALLAGSVKKDAVRARVRGFAGSREAALFPDDVPLSVYDNLIATVGENLGPLHRYYALRKRALGVSELRHWDVYAPLVRGVKWKASWTEAVDLISEALAPLGDEYVGLLREGLLGSWADRYENVGKRSGAFSAGSFSAAPFILMNYKTDSLRDVFTLAHEGGHSMHSLLSARANPFMHYGYSIFEAEVASTFNEELLFRSLLRRGGDPALALWIVQKRADDILATLFRQTMFAEFELRAHGIEEAGKGLTVDAFRAEYGALLRKYFGPGVVLEGVSDLEGLRIPHFYRAFYVYKYATGISAALALAERVLSGGVREREDYFKFLRSGGSRFPIDALRVAGVDMASAAPVKAACDVFAGLVDKLEALLDA
ncbi:MAG: oligoendopeptidase F [Spirochaetaceae bacterium]|nr:oligoendopeptidase F [Spirochaetaceae bacterium]